MQASVQGKKVTQSFEEIFSEYGDSDALDADEETVKLMDKLAEKELAELERNAVE